MSKKDPHESSARTEPFLPPRRKLESPLCRVVLVEPLIPENTGNISRTCVGTGTELHLVAPLGFELTESRVKRAGLDYWNHLALDLHENFESFASHVRESGNPARVFSLKLGVRHRSTTSISSEGTGWFLEKKPRALRVNRSRVSRAGPTAF